ncbi:MAG: hypothetical protein WC277_06810 [Bacilli bacterium]|jgi:hypothetical protein
MSIKITPDMLAGFEQWLTGRGCYAPRTIRGMVLRANALLRDNDISRIPLDEDAAVALVNQLYRSRTQADGYKAAIRRLIEYCREGASS